MDFKAFYESLKEGEEYMTIITTKDVYGCIDQYLRVNMVITSVNQKNESFKDDNHHKELVSKVSKAKKQLRDYEFSINNR